jgi:hypothetical protein
MVSITPKYICKDIWSKTEENCSLLSDGPVIPGPVYWFYILIGRFNNQNWWLYDPTPSVDIAIVNGCGGLKYKKQNLSYMFCNSIPFMERIGKNNFDTPGISIIYNDTVIINQELENKFPISIKEGK